MIVPREHDDVNFAVASIGHSPLKIQVPYVQPPTRAMHLFPDSTVHICSFQATGPENGQLHWQF